ncbi:hypothetical protein H6S82_02080 [Planktothrix sp. FACHB-1355]|nr:MULTISPECIES: hypothetical protein [Oscillatoriales]MBD3557652.1 hypothetical protein [Planktothrix sp. FACHB-1355]
MVITVATAIAPKANPAAEPAIATALTRITAMTISVCEPAYRKSDRQIIPNLLTHPNHIVNVLNDRIRLHLSITSNPRNLSSIARTSLSKRKREVPCGLAAKIKIFFITLVQPFSFVTVQQR